MAELIAALLGAVSVAAILLAARHSWRVRRHQAGLGGDVPDEPSTGPWTDGPDGPDGPEVPAIPAEHARHAPPAAAAVSTLRLSVAAVTLSDHRYDRDSYVIQQDLVGVAQGINSTAMGQAAAALTLSAIIAAQLRHAPRLKAALESCVRSANRTVRAVAQRDPTLAGMAAAIDIAVLEGGTEATQAIFTAHVGTGAIWLVRQGAAEPEQLTTPHACGDGPLLRAVGLAADLCPDVSRVEVRAGDRIILATGSLTRNLGLAGVANVLREHAASPAGTCLDALTAAASADEIADSATVAVAEVVASRAAPPAPLVPSLGRHREPS